MPNRCSIFGCHTNYGTEKERFTLFSLPNDPVIRKKWIRAIPTDLSKLKHPFICIKHFQETDIIRVDKVLYKGEFKEFERERPKLKDNAVPVLFENVPHYLSKAKVITRRLPDVEKTRIEEAIKDSDDHAIYTEKHSLNDVSRALTQLDDFQKRRTYVHNESKSDRPFEQLKIALCGSDQDLIRDDHMNELHVEGSEIERFYVTRLSDGNVMKIDKSGPMLKTKAVPNITLDFQYRNERDSYRFSSALDPVTSNPKIININSSCIISKNSDNSENEAVLLQKDGVPTGNGTFTFLKILENLHLIKKPNCWWTINSVKNFIICARWNENYTADKRVVIESTLAVKVFLQNMEIIITDIMDITCIDDLSSLLERVESYKINVACM